MWREWLAQADAGGGGGKGGSSFAAAVLASRALETTVESCLGTRLGGGDQVRARRVMYERSRPPWRSPIIYQRERAVSMGVWYI
jgi:hypothetical protein